MRIHYQYKNYPLSEKLTRKSERVGLLTSPIYGIMLGSMFGVACIALFPDSGDLPVYLTLASAAAGPFLLAQYRKKKFAQYDAEYAQLLQSMEHR